MEFKTVDLLCTCFDKSQFILVKVLAIDGDFK